MFAVKIFVCKNIFIVIGINATFINLKSNLIVLYNYLFFLCFGLYFALKLAAW